MFDPSSFDLELSPEANFRRIFASSLSTLLDSSSFYISNLNEYE